MTSSKTSRRKPAEPVVLTAGEYATLERTLARRYGYDPNHPDTLEAAVTGWQQQNGVKPTGVWDEPSARRWRKTRRLQERINRTPGPRLAADGDHGPATSTNEGRVL